MNEGIERHLSDGAVYQSAQGTWKKMSASPFSAGLFQGGIVWTGKVMVLVGEPCGETQTSEQDPQCKSGGLAAASYDPLTDSWHRIELQEAIDGRNSSVVSIAHGLGRVGNLAAFSLSIGHVVSYWAVDPASSTWQQLPALPSGATDTICSSGDSLVVAGFSEARAAESVISDTASQDPLVVYTLEDVDSTWIESSGILTAASPFPGTFQCAVGAIAFQVPEVAGTSLYWFDAASQEWTVTPKSGLTGYDSRAAMADTGGGLIVWPSERGGPNVLFFDGSTSSWRSVPKPGFEQQKASFQDFGSDLLVTFEAIRMPPDENPLPQLAILDPAALLSSEG